MDTSGTLKTWKASNWMLRLLSFNRFIINFKLSALAMYRVMIVKLVRSKRISPNNYYAYSQ